PPAGNHPQKQIAWKQRRRDRDPTAMAAAALLAQQRLIDLVAGQREAVRRQAFTPRLDLGTAPIHGAPSPCLLAVADMTEIAAILDRRGALELGGPKLLLDIPMRSAVAGRIEECPLQPGDCPIHSALAPAGHPGKGILGGTTKGGAIRRR